MTKRSPTKFDFENGRLNYIFNAKLEDLDLSNSQFLFEFPKQDQYGILIPKQILDLSSCVNLKQTEELTRQLDKIEVSQGKVVWPEHFDKNFLANQALERVNNLVSKTKFPKIIILFTEYLEVDKPEEIFIRGGRSKVADDINSLSRGIEKHPDFLGLSEDVAEYYTGGCINRPDAGIAFLSLWLISIADALNDSDKIEAARQLLIMDDIEKFVKKPPTGNPPIEDLEIEVANLLLRNTYKDCIKNQWYGIPEGIVNDFAQNWLNNEDRSKTFYNENVSRIMKKSLLEIVEYICDSPYIIMWATIALPEKLEEINKKYVEEKELLARLESDVNLAIPDAWLDKDRDNNLVQPLDRDRFLQNRFDSVENRKQKDIAKMVIAEASKSINADTPRNSCCSSMALAVKNIISLARSSN